MYLFQAIVVQFENLTMELKTKFLVSLQMFQSHQKRRKLNLKAFGLRSILLLHRPLCWTFYWCCVSLFCLVAYSKGRCLLFWLCLYCIFSICYGFRQKLRNPNDFVHLPNCPLMLTLLIYHNCAIQYVEFCNSCLIYWEFLKCKKWIQVKV